MAASVIAILAVLPTIVAHSWMSCPPSFNPSLGRGGIIGGGQQCEYEGNVPVTRVEAGDRLKVGWTSNNHGGGLVRISLVPHIQRKDAAAFKANTMKFACYGHDIRPGKFQYGDCKHPCFGRPGCEYQSQISDVERYDTTIGIPTNLPEGYYVLQTALIVGNGGTPYYSCAKLYIKGGNPNFNCRSNEPPTKYSCRMAAGGERPITQGTKRGDFCYGLNGDIGSVDDNIDDIPINVECDPRLTCSLSTSQRECNANPKMGTITTGPNRDRIQPGCRVFSILPSA